MGRTSRQSGYVMLVLMAVLGVVALFVAVRELNVAGAVPLAEQRDADVLEQARQALIGYAATYRDSHSSATPPAMGYLPCPAVDGNGSAASSCGVAGTAFIGFLPFRTLNLPILRDSTGECLWYAVAGSVKNSPAQLQLNWDAQGQFIITNIDGANLALPNVNDGGPVALIIAPGRLTGVQARNTDATLCGRAAGSGYVNFVEGGAGFPASGPVTLIQGAPTSTVSNDRIAWITGKEIFDRIGKRSDFPALINSLIDEMASCLASGLPTPDTYLAYSSPGRQLGLVPNTSISGTPSYCPPAASPLSVSALQIHMWRNWREQFRYLKCLAGLQCVKVNGVDCKGALIFGGARTDTQVRATAADKSSAGNYLEGSNSSAWASGALAYSGATSFDTTLPTQDVVRCLN